jgi:uncharacterized protein
MDYTIISPENRLRKLKENTNSMYKLYLAVLIIFALIILFAVNFVVYFATVSFFSISIFLQKEIFIIVLLTLNLSFFVSTTLAHWRENLFTKAYYFISCFWLGLLANLLIAITIISLIAGIASVAYPSLRLNSFGVVAIFFAFLYSIYGVWNSSKLQLIKISVPLPKLPAYWQGKKIVQLSDLHLGHIRGEDFFQKIIEKTNAQNPDLVFITGDLFDGMDGNLEALAKLADKIESNDGIYFITGNHETYLGTEIVLKMLEKTKIKHVHDSVVDLNGLKIISIDYPDLKEKKNLPTVLESLKNDFYGFPNILLCHSPVSVEKAKEAGVNLMLSGHTHRGQLFPLGLITKLIFKGYDYGLHRLGDFYIYTTSGAGTWGPPMRTGNKPEIVLITLE